MTAMGHAEQQSYAESMLLLEATFACIAYIRYHESRLGPLNPQ